MHASAVRKVDKIILLSQLPKQPTSSSHQGSLPHALNPVFLELCALEKVPHLLIPTYTFQSPHCLLHRKGGIWTGLPTDLHVCPSGFNHRACPMIHSPHAGGTLTKWSVPSWLRLAIPRNNYIVNPLILLAFYCYFFSQSIRRNKSLGTQTKRGWESTLNTRNGMMVVSCLYRLV